MTLRGKWQVLTNFIGQDELRQVVVTAEETLLALYESYEDDCEQLRVDEFDLKAKTWNTLKLVMPGVEGRLSADGRTLFYEDEEQFFSEEVRGDSLRRKLFKENFYYAEQSFTLPDGATGFIYHAKGDDYGIGVAGQNFEISGTTKQCVVRDMSFLKGGALAV